MTISELRSLLETVPPEYDFARVICDYTNLNDECNLELTCSQDKHGNRWVLIS